MESGKFLILHGDTQCKYNFCSQRLSSKKDFFYIEVNLRFIKNYFLMPKFMIFGCTQRAIPGKDALQEIWKSPGDIFSLRQIISVKQVGSNQTETQSCTFPSKTVFSSLNLPFQIVKQKGFTSKFHFKHFLE